MGLASSVSGGLLATSVGSGARVLSCSGGGRMSLSKGRVGSGVGGAEWLVWVMDSARSSEKTR